MNQWDEFAHTATDIYNRLQELPVAYYRHRKIGGEALLSVTYPEDYKPPKGAVASLTMANQVVMVQKGTDIKLFRAIKLED